MISTVERRGSLQKMKYSGWPKSWANLPGFPESSDKNTLLLSFDRESYAK